MATHDEFVDYDMHLPIPGLICPECAVAVHCDYSRSYLREKALVDAEVEVLHYTAAAGMHMNTVTLSADQLAHIRNLLSAPTA